MARVGVLLVALGLVTVSFGALWQLGLWPGSRLVLPPPVALQRATPQPTVVAPTSAVIERPAISVPILTPAAVVVIPTPLPTPAPASVRLTAADAGDRDHPVPVGGYAVRLEIPSIKLDTPVEQGGIVADAEGVPAWETRPFVAVHYGDLTSLVGLSGNAVIAGHVVTLHEGNVFRLLYAVNLGDEVRVWDQLEREHDYAVAAVRLVLPSDTSVMDRTPDEVLTLITCGGTFDPRTREFSDRLIVTAKPR